MTSGFLKLTVLFFLAALGVRAQAEGDWLGAFSRPVRGDLSARLAPLDADLRLLREDRLQALREEGAYASRARRLGAAEKADAAELSDQRRLRWESARDLSKLEYGRTGADGFVAAKDVAKRADAEGAAFALALRRGVDRLKGEALDDALDGAQARFASLPDCPEASFRDLCAAAAAFPAADKRRWLLAIASCRPADLLAVYDEKRGVQRGPEAFSSALGRFRRALDARARFSDVLPAAAAAAWYSDRAVGRNTEFSAAASASLAAFVRALSEAEAPLHAALCADYADASGAYAEALSLCWVAFRRDPRLFAADLALDQGVLRRALERAWTAAGDASAGVPPPAELDAKAELDAVRGAEKAAQDLEAAVSDKELLAAYAALRLDAPALAVFARAKRYAPLRDRLSPALASALAAAEKGAAAALKASLVRVGSGAEYSAAGFGPALLSYRAAKSGDAVGAGLPSSWAPAFAEAFAPLLGWSKRSAEGSAAFLSKRGYDFAAPCVAAPGRLGADEYLLLDTGNAFFPAEAPTRDSARLRAELVRSRLAEAADAAGVPLSFLTVGADAPRVLSAFSSCAAVLAAPASAKEAPLQ